MRDRRTARRAIFAAAVLAAALGPAVAAAEVRLPADGVPLPAPRPGPADAGIDAIATGAVAGRPSADAYIEERPADPLAEALDALSRGDAAAARATRDTLPADGLDHRILGWAIALSGGRDVSSGEIASAEAELAGWPGRETLRRNFERALAREAPAPGTVIEAFTCALPATTEGLALLARAHLAEGSSDWALRLLVPFWRTERLEAADEIAIIGEFGALIPASDHRFRMERMLHADRTGSAARVAALAGARELFEAWSAVNRNRADAAQLLDAVPEAQRSAGHLFARARLLRRTGRFVEAADILSGAPRDPAMLVDPDAWWVERRVLSRELLDIGRADLAYRIAAGHAAESPAQAADAEFHAGWYALRSLGDAAAAAAHFERVAGIATAPLSRARAEYWRGRAAEAGGPGDAQVLYASAARHTTTFYGQLAAARLGRPAVPALKPEPTREERLRFFRREPVRAILRLEAAGHPARAAILYRGLAEQVESSGELAVLAAMAESRAGHFLALRIGKAAAARGLEVGTLSHPLGAIPGDAPLSGAGLALALAIARQESEFNVGAVSGAGARGLLQLLPDTARDMARKAGLPYSQERLTTDAGYNATLGAAFLSEQLKRFEGSYVLTFAGYNAGPRRAREWVERYGDPRGLGVDEVVDWIERIPYTETRAYVQRVMENYQVYKMLLGGRLDIVADLSGGR